MRLLNPYTGCAVDAEGEVAQRLLAHGYQPEKPKQRRRPARKPAPKKDDKTD